VSDPPSVTTLMNRPFTDKKPTREGVVELGALGYVSALQRKMVEHIRTLAPR